jgi:hypothetical protein
MELAQAQVSSYLLESVEVLDLESVEVLNLKTAPTEADAPAHVRITQHQRRDQRLPARRTLRMDRVKSTQVDLIDPHFHRTARPELGTE